MPSRRFFNSFSRSNSPERRGLTRKKTDTESTFAPSFPNGLPDPYLWKVTHRNRRTSKKGRSSPKGDSKDAKVEFTDGESIFKMGNMFEGLTDDSKFRISMGQGVKDPSLASNTNDASGLKGSSLDLDVIERVKTPVVILKVQNDLNNDNDARKMKAQSDKQQPELSPALLTIPLAGRSRVSTLPKQSSSSPPDYKVERPKEPCPKAVEAIGPSTNLDRLERSKFPCGKRSRMKNYIERTKVLIRAKPPSVRKCALVRSAASLRYTASHRSRYATHLPSLITDGSYRLYRHPNVLGIHSIPQIIITPPAEECDNNTNVLFNFNSPPIPSSNPGTTSAMEVVPVFKEQPLPDKEEEDEAFGRKLATLLEGYIDNAQVRNELRREICKLFAEEKGTAVVVSARSS